jgi:two-component system LytT family sensor kinase
MLKESRMSSVADVGQVAITEETHRAPFTRLLARFWVARAFMVFAASTTLALVFMFPMWSMSPMAWKEDLAEWWGWGLMVPLIVAIDHRLPYSGRELGRRAGAHGVACLLVTALYVYVFFVLRVSMADSTIPGGPHWRVLKPDRIVDLGKGWFIWSCLIYWMIAGGLQAYRYYERYMIGELQLERLEKSYSRARLNALRMQLDPHFLFNALNTISSHVERDPKLTRLMIEHLGDLLRTSLQSKDRQEVPLAEELALLDHYLAIQMIRFGLRLKIKIDIAPEVRYASVPSLFLQPLVENAILHGISHRASGGTIEVTAEPVNGKLAVRVSDDGAGLPAGWSIENSTGLGLSVTRERIAGMYPDGDGSFAIRGRDEGGTVVEIVLPLRVMGEEANEATCCEPLN